MTAECWTAIGEILTGIGTIALAFAAYSAGVKAVREYSEQKQTERMKWVSELFHRFYDENRSYRQIRQKIDFDDLGEIRSLLDRDARGESIADQGERDLLDAFTDYLNFFEYIAFLQKKGQVSKDEIKAMFEYYLKRIIQVDQGNKIRRYIPREGFENLHKLLLQYARESSDGAASKED
jgi:hypothetical protein